MKIAVTGGAGFLGYHVAQKLASQGHQMRMLDIAPFIEQEYPSGAELIKLDTRDQPGCRKAMEGIDAVVHAAAALPLWKKSEIFDINVQGTRNVLDAAKGAAVERVVFICSTAVYGVPDKHPLYEDDPLVGVGPYGQSKIDGEQICEEFRERGMCIPVIRPKTFIGTGRLGVFQILYDWVQSGKRIPVIGNGNNRYQLLEVEDLADAIMLALTGPAEKANDTFNVGAEQFNTVREDVGALCDYAGNGARVMGTPAWLVKPALTVFEAIKLSPLYRWVYGTADKDSFVSIEKIQKTLGWQPRCSNADALIKSYRWYLTHAVDVPEGTGVTHRIAWDQGILKVFKKWL